ncbi:platelet-activating factor acetylhydrolase [Pelomyxa schiedti]|nr:platelet-activating factor acetylhydrolase [Pelomyxa schiedti]
MAFLTPKQRESLHGAIAGYLMGQGFTNSRDAFVAECGLPKEAQQEDKTLLEKKWISILRLQKKVLDLEAQVAQQQQQLAQYQPTPTESASDESTSASISTRRTTDSSEITLTSPAKFSMTGHRGNITSIKFHPKFSIIASGSEDGTIRIWDCETGEFERTIKGHTQTVYALDFNANGNLLVSCSGDLTIKLWDMQTYMCQKTLHGHDHTISSVKFTPNGDHIVTGSRDTSVKVWDTATGYCTTTLYGHTEWVRAVAITPDAALIISASADRTLKVWNFQKGTCVATLEGHSHVIECIAVSPKPHTLKSTGSSEGGSGYLVVSGSRDNTIKVWSLATMDCLTTLSGHDNWVRGVIFGHHSNTYILSGSDDRSIKLWNWEQGNCVKTIEDAHGHPHFISCLDVCPIKPLIASGAMDGSLKIWSAN